MTRRSIITACRTLMRGKVDLSVSGLHHVPASGAVVLAARHYHHLFDGTAILTTVTRDVRVMVALDWVQAGPQRRVAEFLCTRAGWPIVLRPDAEKYRPELAADPVRTATYRADTSRYLMRAAAQSVELLRRGEALLMFPEGYPNIDPSFTPKTEASGDYLLTLPGAIRIPLLAQRAGLPIVPIVPVGLHYERLASGADHWRVNLHFGPPLTVGSRADVAARVAELGQTIRDLSR